MNDLVNDTVRDLNGLRDELVYNNGCSLPAFLQAIDNALALLDALTLVSVFPGDRGTCESIVDFARRRLLAPGG